MFILRSVKNWLTVLFLAVTAMSVLAVYLYVVPRLEDRLVSQKVETLTSATTRVARGSLPSDREGLQAWTETVDRILDGRVVVFIRNRNGAWADSRPGVPNLMAEDYPLVARAVRESAPQSGTVDIQGDDYAAVATPIYASDGSGILGSAMVVAPLGDVHSAVALVERQIFYAMILAIAVALVTGYVVSYFIARRLKRIEHSAEALAGGDFTATVPAGTPDEIGQLGTTFNAMGDSLRAAFSAIEREKERVEILLNDLSEGVLGVSAEGAVTIANPAAAELLGRDLEARRTIDEALPAEIARLWREVPPSDGERTTVLVLDERSLEATVYPAAGHGDVASIIVLRDVTAQVRLERARRDFIATASHELKTPLFSLSGFMELLDEGDLDATTEREFLTLMREQVDRLTDLSLSLLDLSQVDAGAVELHPAKVDLATLAQATVSEFQVAIAARGLEVSVEAADGDTTAYCDEQRVAQVLRVLVDNAVKFSPEGGSVGIVVTSEAEDALLTVSDQGPGIPARDLPHIFERFYSGSADGNNKTGTGLGLSIAKELIELMDGAITVTSSRTRGTRFIVRLPRRKAPRAGAEEVVA